MLSLTDKTNRRRVQTFAEHKKHVVEPTGHFVSPTVVKGETLNWLDSYLGPVE
jgi:hypothetical protein